MIILHLKGFLSAIIPFSGKSSVPVTSLKSIDIWIILLRYFQALKKSDIEKGI